jgi:hypothetical protein
MHEKTIEIHTADGRMETFITHPEQGGPFAPVVVYMDVWGLREERTTSTARWRWSAILSSYLISTIARAASATNGATSVAK